ncbi:SDR family NAD(P)-dependent oxidoreductase, partial [Bacillus cereus]
MVENQVIVITGAARGIGFEIGQRFAENGGRIVLSDIDQAAVEAAA